MPVTFEQVKQNPAIRAYIKKADESLIALGYTEHSFAHSGKSAETARWILLETGHPERLAELAAIAAYLHDIGNVINRVAHERTGALLAFSLLKDMGADPDDVATVITAIGNHDEATAFPVNDVAAALIIADKTDVRRSRVRNKETIELDIHDRVNYAVEKSELKINKADGELLLHLTIDTTISAISDYFEIFLSRMLLCRKAAEKLSLTFGMVINGQRLM
ncbi:MAG: HD domain-containing protein [Christensenellales bacterium]|jgi:metal-dependent HD superfamily phosphatase/phosphodiesterase